MSYLIDDFSSVIPLVVLLPRVENKIHIDNYI